MMRACDWAVRISASHIVGHAIDPWKDLIFVSIRGEKQKPKTELVDCVMNALAKQFFCQ